MGNFKLKNPYCPGSHKIGSTHGTNPNFAKSGDKGGAPFIGGLAKSALGGIGGILGRGAGRAGGSLLQRIMSKFRGRGGNQGNQNVATTANPNIDPTAQVNPTAPVVDPTAPVVDTVVPPVDEPQVV